jgi:hypothetical protein
MDWLEGLAADFNGEGSRRHRKVHEGWSHDMTSAVNLRGFYVERRHAVAEWAEALCLQVGRSRVRFPIVSRIFH